MIKVIHRGNFKHLEKFLDNSKKMSVDQKLRAYAELGVAALAANTPTRTGRTASSWSYEIKGSGKGTEVYWTNDNENKGVNIAIILQYGHGTGTGGYVVGRDYINPAIQPVFDAIAEDIWKEVCDG